MIDSILFFGLVVVFISGLMIVLSRYNKLGAHSIDYQKYLENIELGKQVNNIIDKGVILEGSLIKERKYALDLYRKQRPCFDTTSVQLRL